ncbi:MAG: DUF4340 domain-containing protein, partial [Methylomonas sp.]
MNHINTKVLLGLGAATGISLIAAVLIGLSQQPVTDNAGGRAYVIEGLQTRLNDIKSIGLHIAEDKAAVTLANDGQGWRVREKDDYPADMPKIKGLLLTLSNVVLFEPKTSVEEHYPELGVEDIKRPDAKGVLLTLEGLSQPAQVIIGNANSRNDGVFVRKPGDKQSWLTQGRLAPDRDPAKWLDTALADIGADRIAEITLAKPGQPKAHLIKARDGGARFRVDGVPAGREAVDVNALQGLASTLSGLVLEDVASAQKQSAPDDSQLLKAHYRCFDGLQVDIAAWAQAGKDYARLRASLDTAQAETFIQSEQAKAKADYDAKQKAAAGKNQPEQKAPGETPLAVGDPAKFHQQKLEALQAEADKLNQRWQGWVYVIPAYKYANMDKSLNDVLKPLAATAKPAAVKPPPT